MNILNDIMLDFNVDTKVLDATPAKLKLRDKTLKGLRSNIEDENTLPGMMLAKKKKNKKQEELKEEVREEIKVDDNENKEVIEISEESVEELKNITSTILESWVNATGESKKLRLSQEKEDALRQNVSLMPNFLSEIVENENIIENNDTNISEINNEENTLTSFENVNIESEVNEIENVKVDEIPVDSIQEESNFNIEQGSVGNVSEVSTLREETFIPEVNIDNIPSVEIEEKEEKKVPTLDEIREKIITTNDTTSYEYKNAYDKASSDSIFNETNNLRDEVNNLKSENQKSNEELSMIRNSYNYALNMSQELEKTYEVRKREADEAEKLFYESLENQKKILQEMKKSLKEENEFNLKESKELGNKTSVLEKENGKKEEDIKSATEKLNKYKELLNSLQAIGDDANKMNDEVHVAKVAL